MSAETAYHGEMGEEFAAYATDDTYNAHTERPAMLRLAGDVRGLRVLDLGCGAGHLAAELLARGAAHVTGVDGSETLLRVSRERLAAAGDEGGDGGDQGRDGDEPRVVLHRHDLEQPLDFLQDRSYDLAVLALAYHHVEARGRLLAEVRRVLRPGGTLLVSTTHPTGDWQYFGGSYFADDWVTLPFADRFGLSYWRMTLETFLGELLGAGFVLEELVEPRATEQGRVVDPRRYEKSHHSPVFLVVRLRNP